MKNILITGGAGFVGSNLCKRLLDEKNNVICVDNFNTGRKVNIQHLIDHENFQLIEHDIIDEFPVEELDWMPHQIYNLASPASPPAYQKFPIYTINTNFTGAQRMLGLAGDYGASILQASTSEIYGDPEVHPQPESYWGNVNTLGPRSCYDESKRIAETLCYEYGKMLGIDYKIIRIFNTYGPNMDPKDGRVVSNFINQALANEDITIYGEGSQTRSFQYVDDLVEGMIRTMNTENFHGPVNLGNPGEFTMNQLAEIVLDMIPESTSKIIYEALPVDDPMVRKPVIDIAKKVLDWEPTVSLKEGLVKTIEYFKQYHK